MPRRTPQKNQIKNERPLDNLDLDLGLSNDGLTTQLLSDEMGSLTKKVKLEVRHVLSTPQSAPQSSKTSAPKLFVFENNSTTPTLPQGAAAERQLLLQKKDVRRRLDMELAGDSTQVSLGDNSSDGFKTPKAKRGRSKSAVVSIPALSLSPSPQRNGRNSAADKGSRFDSSLGLLTKRFLSLLQNAENGILDLNQASVTLAVQKRRIYDITNVLEGIGLLKKISKNNIQWKGTGSAVDTFDPQRSLGQDVTDLEAKENQLDELIQATESELRSLSEDKRYAYITYNDLKAIPEYRDMTVMAVRAPPETKLQVPHPAEGYQIHMKSEHGEIEVFLCPEEETSSSSASSSSTSSPTSKLTSGFPSPVNKLRHHRKASHYSSQFIDDDESKSLLLETMDQNQEPSESGIDISSMAVTAAPEPFLSLEPPLDESAYMFTLGDAEGIFNLFDSF